MIEKKLYLMEDDATITFSIKTLKIKSFNILGSDGIRTHDAIKHIYFQDRHFRPLSHTSKIYLSISPKTISKVPIIVTTSAIK